MEKIKGLIDAPFTPFLPNGDINLDPIPTYAAMLRKNGLQGVFINGSSGEGYMLTEEENALITEYRKLVPAMREFVLDTVKKLNQTQNK